MRKVRYREGKQFLQGLSSGDWHSSPFPLAMCLPSETGGFQVAPLRWIRPDIIPFMQPFFQLA